MAGSAFGVVLDEDPGVVVLPEDYGSAWALPGLSDDQSGFFSGALSDRSQGSLQRQECRSKGFDSVGGVDSAGVTTGVIPLENNPRQEQSALI